MSKYSVFYFLVVLTILFGVAAGASAEDAWAPLPKGTCDPKVIPNPNAGLREYPGKDGCPSGTVRVDDFCIDQYEASLVFVDGAEHWSPFHNPALAKGALRAVSLEGAIPQGYISGKQAARACANSGKRLCTDHEWLRACQGTKGAMFPYGGFRKSDRKDYACNEEGRQVHPAVRLFGDQKGPDGKPINPFSMIQHACVSQLPDTVARNGSYRDCVTPDGVYDLMGNVHEWTAAPNGTFRGGYYMDTRRNRTGCFYVTTAHSTEHWDYSTGFRCCADPKN